MRIVVAVLIALAISFWVGGMNTLSTLRDPDTCWILALGQLICQHGLPQTDPFSYTYYLMTQMGVARPFVMYQWLSEVLFFLTYQAGGLMAMVTLVSLLSSIAFVVLPHICLKDKKLNPALSLIVCCLAHLACAFHFFARPEIFSLVPLALSLCLIDKIIAATERKRLLSYTALYAGLTAIWCNLHASFILAIILAFLPLLARPQTPKAVPGLTLPLASALASLLNPVGFKLWAYLPKLFFLNITFRETRMLTLSDLGQIELYPFFAILLIYLICLFQSIGRYNAAEVKARLLLAFLVLAMTICSIRLIIYATIIMAFEIPLFLSIITKSRQLPPAKFVYLLAPLVCLCGSFYVSQCVAQPQLPQPMPGFNPPFKAIAYINQHPPKGPIFNESRFGDMIIWYVKPPLPVFIDTRYDMYGEDFFKQYAKINDCADGWQKALQDFGIEWVFVPPTRPIARALANDKDWKILYYDPSAIIMKKK